MDTNRFGGWLQIGANVGLFAGLILVALQMQQNSSLLKLQLTRDDALNYVDAEMGFIGENYAEVWQKTVENPRSLTLSEMRIEDAVLFAHGLNRWINTYRLYEAGLMDEVQWKSEVNRDARTLLGSPFGRAWWDEMYETNENYEGEYNYFPKEVFQFVEEELQRNPVNYAEERFERIKKRLDKYLPPPE